MKERTYTEILTERVARQRGKPEGKPRADTASPRAEEAPAVLKRYLPGERLGRGRLGEIYEALDQTSGDFGVDRRVALQVIDAAFVATAGHADELSRAYAALRAAPHPNVVRVLDFGREGQSLFAVFERLHGLSAREILDDAAPDALSEDEALAVAAAVGDALRYLRAQNMMHAGVRPESVFITLDYIVKLLDLAPLCALAPAHAGAATEPPDERDDVYALACLTYELLSARHPFNGSSAADARRASLQPTLLANLRSDRWRALARGLALQRAQRTATVAEFLEELGAGDPRRLRPQPAVAAVAAVAAEPPRAPVPQPRPGEARSVDTLPVFPAAAPPWVNAPVPAARASSRAVASGRRRTLRIALALLVLAVLGAAGAVYYDRWPVGALDLLSAARTRAPATLDETRDSQRSSAVPEGVASEPNAPAPTRPPSSPPPVEAGSPGASGTEPMAEAARTPLAPPPQADPGKPADVAGTPNERRATSADEPAIALPTPPTSGAAVTAAPARDAPAPPAAREGPLFEIAEPVVAVSEGQGAAAIVIRRNGDATAAASVIWWCEPQTALGDEDFADLGRRRETFAPGETTRTVFVPLINDVAAEATEVFLVHVGQYDSTRTLRVSSTARVEINDDD